MVPLFALFYFQSANSEEFCSKKAEGGMGKDRLNPVFQLAFIILAFFGGIFNIYTERGFKLIRA